MIRYDKVASIKNYSVCTMKKPLLLALFAACTASGLDLFVSKSDGTGVCVTTEKRHPSRFLFPIYNLGGADLPKDVPQAQWTDSWKSENLTTYRDGPEFDLVATDGSSQWKLVGTNGTHKFIFFAQASNATFLVTEGKPREGGHGFRVLVDHLDGATGERNRTWAEFCSDLETAKETCELLAPASQFVGNILENGQRWVLLNFDVGGDTLSLSGHWRNQQRYMTWKTGCDSGSASSSLKCILQPDSIFARTHRQPGVFKLANIVYQGPVDEDVQNRLSRNFTVGSAKKICLNVWEMSDEPAWSSLNVFDAAGREVQTISMSKRRRVGPRSKLEIPLPSEGHFRLEMANLTDWIADVVDCARDRFEISDPAVGCSVTRVDDRGHNFAILTLPSPHPNSSINDEELSQSQMGQVCTKLATQNQQVQVCGYGGCKTKHCPAF